jgi:uncharacterized protein YcgI (DUF1989 family)
MTESEGASARDIHVPARTGVAFRADAGTTIEVVDVAGEQTADFWACRHRTPGSRT